jgi:hypothetical protein
MHHIDEAFFHDASSPANNVFNNKASTRVYLETDNIEMFNTDEHGEEHIYETAISVENGGLKFARIARRLKLGAYNFHWIGDMPLMTAEHGADEKDSWKSIHH